MLTQIISEVKIFLKWGREYDFDLNDTDSTPISFKSFNAFITGYHLKVTFWKRLRFEGILKRLVFLEIANSSSKITCIFTFILCNTVLFIHAIANA